MSGKWESMAVAALLSSTMNAQSAPMENNNQDTENPNRIEVVQEDTRDTLRNDSAMAWEEVQNMAENMSSNNENNQVSDVAQSMREDAQEFNNVNERLDFIASNETNDNENTLRTITEYMTNQESHPTRISQRYGIDSENDENRNVYGDFLEYLATSGDEQLGETLGVPENQRNPENITMALAYGPEIPYETQEQIYQDAREDGRYDDYREQSLSIASRRERYPELSLEGEMPQNGARLSVGMEQAEEFTNRIIQNYGENANGLINCALNGNRELAEQFGFGDEKVDAQQLIYMLAIAEPLSREVQDRLVKPKKTDNTNINIAMMTQNQR